MKLVLMADIHGNLPALGALLEAERDADAFYCAGDLADIGPFPAEVIDLVRARGIRSVAGNHDRKVIEVYRAGGVDPEAPPDGITWTMHVASKLDEARVAFLASLPSTLTLEADGFAYGICHEHKGFEPQAGAEAFDAMWSAHFAAQDAGLPRRLVVGHTHRRCRVQAGPGREVVNPGSLSFSRPDYAFAGAKYFVVRDGALEARSVNYDRTPILRAFREIGPRLGRLQREFCSQFWIFLEDREMREGSNPPPL